jgi:hypothetical protein
MALTMVLALLLGCGLIGALCLWLFYPVVAF